MISANADRDKRTIHFIPDGRKRLRPCHRCPPESGHKATHVGAANGCGMMRGCEFHVRKWVKDPNWDLKRRVHKESD